jgi:hypothetical protein
MALEMVAGTLPIYIVGRANARSMQQECVRCVAVERSGTFTIIFIFNVATATLNASEEIQLRTG